MQSLISTNSCLYAFHTAGENITNILMSSSCRCDARVGNLDVHRLFPYLPAQEIVTALISSSWAAAAYAAEPGTGTQLQPDDMCLADDAEYALPCVCYMRAVCAVCARKYSYVHAVNRKEFRRKLSRSQLSSQREHGNLFLARVDARFFLCIKDVCQFAWAVNLEMWSFRWRA